MNILLIEGIHPQAKQFFEQQGFEVQVKKSSISEKELIQCLPFCALGIRSQTQIKSSFLNQAKDLLSIAAFCIGTNQIDIEQAKKLGIAVFNSPYSNTRSVAELVIANIVNLSRKIMHFNQEVHAGKWEKTAKSSYEVRGKILGIIGYGHIGSQVSILAESLGMKVFYYDIQRKLPLGNAKPVNSLDELLSKSNFVTLHVPQTPQTKNMISKRELHLMKKGSYLINTSRGNTVHLKNLVSALKEKHLSGVAVDVFPEEPSSNNDTFSSDLQKLDHVILTPHIAGSTQEAQIGIAQDVTQSLTHYLTQGDSTGAVNFPHLCPPPIKKNSFRIANVHQNIPGRLSQINHLISKSNINVQIQYLSTLSDIGYLIIDIESTNKKQVDSLIQQIQKLKTSITTRWIREISPQKKAGYLNTQSQ